MHVERWNGVAKIIIERSCCLRSFIIICKRYLKIITIHHEANCFKSYKSRFDFNVMKISLLSIITACFYYLLLWALISLSFFITLLKNAHTQHLLYASAVLFKHMQNVNLEVHRMPTQFYARQVRIFSVTQFYGQASCYIKHPFIHLVPFWNYCLADIQHVWNLDAVLEYVM